MAATSSTSNSEPKSSASNAGAGLPWAFVLAILIVIAFEIFLRTRPPHELIAYPELAASDDQTVTYKAVRQTIAADGPADVALIGSSQMREGVSMPVLIDALHQSHRNLTVANYATRGARADAMQAAVQFLLHQKTPPKLIVIGLSVRDLRTQDIDWPRLAIFWDAGDWLTEAPAMGWPATDVLPTVIRNEAGKIVRTLAYRDQLAIDLASPIAPIFGLNIDREGNPILGEQTSQHAGGRGLRDLINPRIAPRRMLAMARQSYAYAEPAKPSEPLTRRLQTMIRQIESAGVKAVIVQMPVADYLENELEKRGLNKAFDRSVNSLIAGTSVRYIPTASQPFKPTHAHFTDMQHFNRPGAEAFSQWLATEIGTAYSTPVSR